MTDSASLLRNGWYCDGQWRNSSQHYQVTNPATGDVDAQERIYVNLGQLDGE